MNEYLIKNYLRTVISDLASPATFLYLQWNIVCDEIPDLDYALELIHSLEQALELIHSECLEEVAADQIMQAFPMDNKQMPIPTKRGIGIF